ncbi:MAG TPA: ABC transporter ATP-binding protein [Candidatus Limnocylindrales bacterium]|jgi:iron complex transport system ATP-binding protein|nr:ABC transporter ATP-binding protein [Candidatus Limnocylindrales bacterium]
MSGTDLVLRSVGLAYGRREVLRDVDLALARGERAALLGPNGAGKSSLLRAITGGGAGAERRGTVLLDGVPIEEIGRGTLARRLAVVPGQTVIAFPLRVEELVALGRIPHEHPLLGPRPADRVAVEAAIDRTAIGHLVGRDVRELSLGERQLVVLAMAVAQGARLLLLDEPTVHLDLRHQVAVMELLADLSERDGVTVLAVLHDIALARHFFPRLLLVSDGRLVADGPPTDVLTGELVSQVYGVDGTFLTGVVGTA